MTRSTAPASCWPIWARLSSGTAGSPRRSAASSAWAASIAFSPPLTATYMDLLLDTRGARHGGQKISAGQDQIEAARKQRRERGPLGPESCPKPGDAELVAVLDPGAGEAQPPAPGEVGDFDHQRGGAVGIGVEPEGETVERRQARRVADEGEGGAVAGFGLGTIAVEAKMRKRRTGSLVQPDRRLEIEQGQRRADGGAAEGTGRQIGRRLDRDDPAGMSRRVQYRTEDPLRVAPRIGEAREREIAGAGSHSPLARVKKSTRVAAISARSAERAASRARTSPAISESCSPSCRCRSWSKASKIAASSAWRRFRPATWPKPTGPSAIRTAQRVIVISPRLNGAPLPEIRPRTMTRPVSAGRRSV